jgi:hypothetical protein
MSALQSDLNVTLDACLNGTTVKVINDSLALSATPFNADAQAVLSIASGVSNQAVSLGSLTTVTTLLMISDQPLTVKLNGEATGHLCQNLLLTGSAITGVTLSNASGFTATPRIYMLG